MATTRFTNGITNAVKNSTLQNALTPDPTRVFTYFNDFSTYASGDWTITAVEAGAGSAAYALVADEPFGALGITNDAADDDSAQFQLTTENFTLSTGKKAWFKARFKVSDATQSDFLIGLAVLDTTLMGSADGDGNTDGIFFSKDDGDTQLDFQVQKNTTTGQLRATNIATVSTSYITVGFEWDGARYINYYVNDVYVGQLDLTGTPSTYLPDTPITVSFGIVNGEAVAKVMTVDYVYAAIER